MWSVLSQSILPSLLLHPAMTIVVVDGDGRIVLSSSKDEADGINFRVGERIQHLGIDLEQASPASWEPVCTAGLGRRILVWRISLAQGYQLLTIYSDDRQAPHLSGELAQQLKVFFDSSFDEIYVTDGEGITIAVNSACERLYDVPASRLIGRNVMDLERQGVFYPSVTLQVLRQRKPLTVVQTTCSGRRILATGNPVFDDKGRIAYVVSNSRDITEILSLRQEVDRMHRVAVSMSREIDQLREVLSAQSNIVAVSPKTQQVLRTARQVARLDSTVLLLGESGVGKDVVARYIHDNSNRQMGPFVCISCPCIPEHLMESELFGYEEGAFTGASRRGKKGLIESANGGTLFFDEIGDLPLGLQAKLLRSIQEQKITRVGGTRTVDVSIRIVSATNRDLAEMVAAGSFREDLYYRLNVVPIRIPPLRERPEDIGPLVEHFTARLAAKYRVRKKVSQEAMQVLAEYPWPGNVREVANVVEHLVAITEGSEIVAEDVKRVLLSAPPPSLAVSVNGLPQLRDAVDEVERQMILRAYSQTGSTYGAAKQLGVNQSTIVRKLRKYGIQTLRGGQSWRPSARSPRAIPPA